MRFIRTIVAVLLALGAFLASDRALGTIITVEVEGAVGSVETGGGFALDGSIGMGSEMAGFVTYNTDAVDQDSSEGQGVYPVVSISMSIGNYIFTHNSGSPDFGFFRVSTVDPTYAAISPDPRFDGTITVSGTPQTYDDITWGWTYMELFNLWTSDGEYIPTTALPDLDSWPELSVFDNRKLFEARFYGQGDDYFGIYGGITSLNVVPEPGTVLLLGLGGLVLVRRRRR